MTIIQTGEEVVKLFSFTGENYMYVENVMASTTSY